MARGRGRPSRPLAVAKITGADKQNPDRYRETPENPNPIGDPPDYFSGGALKAWNEIVERAPKGVLTATDSHQVEAAALLIAEMRLDFESFNSAQMNNLRQCLACLGMTPVDRRRLARQPGEKEGNPFDDF